MGCASDGQGSPMRLFAIADLHLPGGDDKPMNVFGTHWEDHFDRISADWQARVGDGDCVQFVSSLFLIFDRSCGAEHHAPERSAVNFLSQMEHLRVTPDGAG